MSRLTAEERRAQVIRAAVAEFAQGGLAGTSTEDIARHAGISQPYLFRLFGSKKELFLAAVEYTFSRARETLLGAAGSLSGEEALHAMGDQYREFLADRTLLLTQLHAFAACGDEDVRQVVRSCFGKLWLDVAERTGATDEQLSNFFGKGMLVNVAAAMDLTAVVDLPWVRACLE
jgi:AcrR family transcriptional regulator